MSQHEEEIYLGWAHTLSPNHRLVDEIMNGMDCFHPEDFRKHIEKVLDSYQIQRRVESGVEVIGFGDCETEVPPRFGSDEVELWSL